MISGFALIRSAHPSIPAERSCTRRTSGCLASNSATSARPPERRPGSDGGTDLGDGLPEDENAGRHPPLALLIRFPRFSPLPLAGPLKGRAPKTGYERDLFGSGWKDPDRNGCDARNDMLNRDLTDRTHKPGTRGCVVTSGVLADPLTATTINFVRGNATSTAVQIDHVVALSDAWQKGAQQLTADQRESFANDPLNLLATDGPTNAAKGDSDAASWLPPNKSFRCEYVALQTAVKAKYGLWMTGAEQDAVRSVLTNSCADQPVPEDQGGVSVPVAARPTPTTEPAPEPAEVPAPKQATPDGQESNVFYQNCSAVRAAGAAPIHIGDPGWDRKFDRDGDGIGCE